MKLGFQIDKAITENSNINAVVASGTIREYDIAHASASAMYFIRGNDKEFYDQLISMPKLQRNKTVGLMIRDDPTLQKKIHNLYLKWLNMFLEANKIRSHQFLWSNNDSIVVCNKIPLKTQFENEIVQFVNKNGDFSSVFKIKGQKVLFDSMGQRIIIMGINDDCVQKSEFVNSYLKGLISLVEKVKSLGYNKILPLLKEYRELYINNSNFEIYRDLTHQNQFMYRLKTGRHVYYDDYRGSENLVRDGNYRNFVLPIMNTIHVN